MITVIVVAYNRLESLKRLLKSLNKAYYDENNVRLIISIDKSNDNHSIFEYSNNFDWRFGEKVVIYNKENLGLRKHIIKCGDLSQVYGDIIVLEDDLYVSPDYYNYAKQALDYYRKNNSIAGISLYSHKRNPHTGDTFNPMIQESDVFFMQFPSSWGQAWTKEQWLGFKNWYESNSEELKNKEELPSNVVQWPKSSWLKYFVSYVVEKELFFVYPYKSLSTNFADKGTHFGYNTNIYQVSICYSSGKKYNFCDLKDSNSLYDSFFESIYLKKYIESIHKRKVIVDLYNNKSHQYKNKSDKLIVSKEILTYKVIDSYSNNFIVPEMNIFTQNKGNDFFLYDTNIKTSINKKLYRAQKEKNIIAKLDGITFKELILLIKFKIKKFIER